LTILERFQLYVHYMYKNSKGSPVIGNQLVLQRATVCTSAEICLYNIITYMQEHHQT